MIFPGKVTWSRSDRQREGILVKTTTEKGFRLKIRDACREVGTYKEAFESTIELMAEYYVRAQMAKEQWRSEGSPLLMEQVNKAGNTYFIRHPLLQEIDNCSRTIMQLKKELGLTPAAIKRINEAALGKKQLAEDDPLALALGELKLLKNVGS